MKRKRISKTETNKRYAIYRKNNPDKVLIDNLRRKNRRDNRKECYLTRLLHWVKSRCENKSWAARYYRDRGVQCRIDIYDLALIWIRDKAWLLEWPHLDRIDPDAHYEINNIRFIEGIENLKRARHGEEIPEFVIEKESGVLVNEPGMDG